MVNIVVAVLLVAIVCGVSWYLIRAKRRGKKCVGCPYAEGCGSKRNGPCSQPKVDIRSDSK